MEERFKALLDAFFTRTSVPPEELAMLPPFCSQANVELYWLQVRPDAAEGSVCAPPNTQTPSLHPSCTLHPAHLTETLSEIRYLYRLFSCKLCCLLFLLLVHLCRVRAPGASDTK